MATFTVIWAFVVRGDRIEEFLRHYRADGSWAELFRRAPAYQGTRLLRDRADPLRFVTLDDWSSEADYRTFRSRFEREYQALDRACEGLTVSESPVGQFDDASGEAAPGGA